MCLHHVVPECHTKPFIPSQKKKSRKSDIAVQTRLWTSHPPPGCPLPSELPPPPLKQPLTHPQVKHDLDRLLVLHWDVHRDVVVETGTHWEPLRQGGPVVFPA